MDKTLSKVEKDQKIMRILKVSELRYHIGSTNLGPLDLMLRYGEEDYHFLLDSNPLEKDENESMLKLFGIK